MGQINLLPILNTPLYSDYDITIDSQDSDKTKRTTLGKKVKAGLSDPSVTADNVNDGATKVLMTTTERTKLAGVQTNAQPNLLERVNGQTGVGPSKDLTLTLDDIPDGVTRKAGDVAFDTARNTDVNNTVAHLTNFSNPHNTTKAQVGLANVTNDVQLSRTAGNFSSLLEKPDVQYHLDDVTVIQDSADSEAIKKVSNKTNLIWYGSYIQERGPSINYNHFVIAGSTTYRLNSLVSIGGNIYMCSVAHQSSSSFAADLALGYWTVIGGGGAGGNTLTSGSGSPVGSGVNPGDLYVDILTGDVYYWNGLIRQPISGGGGGGGVEYTTPTTTGNKITFSFGTGANYIEETEISYDPLTQTRDWNGTTQTGTTTFDSSYIGNYDGSTLNFDNTDLNFANGSTLDYDSTVVSNHNGDTTNYTGGTINTTNTTQTNAGGSITNTNTTITNAGTTTITGGTYNNTTLNNTTFTGTISGAAALGSDEKLQATWTTSSQVIPLTTVPRSGIKSLQIVVVGGNTQISPSDYTYNAGTNEITMVTVPPINPTTIEIQYPIKDALVALPADTLQATQTAHGFVALDWIRSDETTSTWVKAQANTVGGLGSWHVVSVIDANTFLVSKDGTHTIPNALALGEYVLSDSTAGGYTQTLPTNPSSYILYGMEVINSTTVNFYTVIATNVAALSGGRYTTRTAKSTGTNYQSVSGGMVVCSQGGGTGNLGSISFVVLPGEYYRVEANINTSGIFGYADNTPTPATVVAFNGAAVGAINSTTLCFIYE